MARHKRILLFVALCQLAAGATAHAQTGAAGPDPGQAVAMGAGPGGPGAACFSCHGADGAGQAGASFPRLSGLSYDYLRQSMIDYASGARDNKVMTPIAKALSEAQRDAVSRFYADLPLAPAERRPPQDLAAHQHGAAIAAIGSAAAGVQACLNCHGPGGAGLPPNYPPLAAQHATYLEAQLRAWRDGTRRSDRVAAQAMESIARSLSDADIRAVAAYYASLAPAALPDGPRRAASSGRAP